MKKLLCALLVVSLVLCSAAFAEEDGIITYDSYYYDIIHGDEITALEGAEYLNAIAVLALLDADQGLESEGFSSADITALYFFNSEDYFALCAFTDTAMWTLMPSDNQYYATKVDVDTSLVTVERLMELFAENMEGDYVAADLDSGVTIIKDTLNLE